MRPRGESGVAAGGRAGRRGKVATREAWQNEEPGVASERRAGRRSRAETRAVRLLGDGAQAGIHGGAYWKQLFVSENMKLVRVLDLENSSGAGDADLEQMLKLLRRLKFLLLRGCREIRCLPSSVGDLRQLQTLDIRHTSIVKLPGNITMLQKLQYIRAGTSIQAQESSTPCLSVPKYVRTSLPSWCCGARRDEQTDNVAHARCCQHRCIRWEGYP